MNIRTLFIASLLLLTQNGLMAATAPHPSTWSGNVQLGYTGTGGNSEDNNVSGKFNLLHKISDWSSSYKLTALYSDSYTNVTAERYTSNMEWTYSFKAKNYAFINNDSYYDKFSPYEASVTTAIGFGRRLINAEKVTLDLQAGPGYRYAQVANSNKEENNLVGTVASVLNWNISKTASFQETLGTDIGKGNSVSKSESALSMDIVGNLGMQVSYTITHNSIIPVGSTKTKHYDYITDVTLLFSF